MTLRVVDFDGNGRPRLPGIETGDVLLLVQGEDVGVVVLELLPPEQHGPALWHATNEAELKPLAVQAVLGRAPRLGKDRDWILVCPPEIAAQATFAADAPARRGAS